jgi:hypothetical protein
LASDISFFQKKNIFSSLGLSNQHRLTLPGTNTPSYFAAASVMKKKRFMTLASHASFFAERSFLVVSA